MNAGAVSSGITIGRLDVRWRVDAELRETDRARLDGLVRELCDGPLEDALTDTPGGTPAEVCIRRLVVPAHSVRWDSSDAELISGWAKVIGHAVRVTAAPGGDIVRFASRAHARADLIASVLTGDCERLWAWQLLGLWATENWPDAEAVSHTVAVAVGERPGTLVALVIAAARAGQLGRFIEYVGPGALTEFARRAWLAAGGTLGPRPPAVGQDRAADAALVDRLVALLHQRSEIIASSLSLPAARLAAPARSHGSGSAAAPGNATATAPGPAAASRSPVQPGPLAESLAALALLEVEPAMAAHPDAWTAVSATAGALLSATADEPRPQPATPDAAPAPDHPPGEATASPTWSAIRPQSPRPEPVPPRPDAGTPCVKAQAPRLSDGGAAPVPPSTAAATSWGGLLFLLPVVAELAIPASVTAEPGEYGVGLRPVLHELGRQLLARAAPGAEPADVRDPVLLAFCGLSPGSQAPRVPEPPASERIELDAGSVVAALRERLPASSPTEVIRRCCSACAVGMPPSRPTPAGSTLTSGSTKSASRSAERVSTLTWATCLGWDAWCDSAMSELGLMPPPTDARVTPPRIDAALEAMVSRLGRALEAVGDEQAARFLRSLAGDPGTPAADGGVVGLPQGDLQPIDRLIKALGIGAAERDLLVLSLVGHCHEGVAAILRGLHPEGRPWATLGLAATLAERGCLAGVTSRAQLRDALNASVLLRYGAVIIEGGGPAPERTLRPAPHLWEALTGLGGWPEGAQVDPRPAPPWGLDE
jgi:hypothetical protein